MANLKLVPQNAFSWSFDVTQNNASIAQILHIFSLKEKATLNIQGTTVRHTVSTSWVAITFLKSRVSRWRAQKPSALVNAFQLEYPGHSYAVKKESIFGRAFVLMENDRQIGFIKPEGVFTRKADVSLPDEIPMPVQIFVLWLVLVLWKRDSEAASAMQISQH